MLELVAGNRQKSMTEGLRRHVWEPALQLTDKSKGVLSYAVRSGLDSSDVTTGTPEPDPRGQFSGPQVLISKVRLTKSIFLTRVLRVPYVESA